MISVGTAIKFVTYKAMNKLEEYQGYTGCFPAECDFGLNVGAIWYAYQAVRDGNPRNSDRINNPPLSIPDFRHRFLNKMRVPQFCRQAMKIDAFLGSGSYGNVWRGQFGLLGSKYAIKQSTSTKNASELWKERDILIRIKGPRVVNLVGCFFEGDLYMIFELCYSSLTKVRAKINEENKVRFTLQLAEAIEWIHKNCILHCDIRSDNLLITTSNNIVVSDFGLAMPISNEVEEIISPKLRGLPEYQDFECNTELKYAKSSDMFSLACTLYEIWCGEFLMKYNLKNSSYGRQEYALVYKQGRVKGLRDGEMSDSQKFAREPLTTRVAKTGGLCTMMTGLIAERPNRLTSKELLNHETIKELYSRLETNKWKLENGDENVVKDYVGIDYDKPYIEINSKATPEANAAFLGIYYDENDEIGKNEQLDHRKSLQSYDTHVIAKTLVEHNLVENLIQGLANKDPSALGLVEQLVAGFLGRSCETAKNDIANVSHRVTPYPVHNQKLNDHRHFTLHGVSHDQHQTQNTVSTQTEVNDVDKQTVDEIAETNAVNLSDNVAELSDPSLESNDHKNTQIFKSVLGDKIPKCSLEFAKEYKLDSGILNEFDGTFKCGIVDFSERDKSSQYSDENKEIERPPTNKVAKLLEQVAEGVDGKKLKRDETNECSPEKKSIKSGVSQTLTHPSEITAETLEIPEVLSDKTSKLHSVRLGYSSSSLTAPTMSTAFNDHLVGFPRETFSSKNGTCVTSPPTQMKHLLVSKGVNRVKISGTGHGGVRRTNVPCNEKLPPSLYSYKGMYRKIKENVTKDKALNLTATGGEQKKTYENPDFEKHMLTNDDSSPEDAISKSNTDDQKTIDDSERAADTVRSSMNIKSKKSTHKTRSMTTKSKEKEKQGATSKTTKGSRSTTKMKTKPKKQSPRFTERTSSDSETNSELKTLDKTKNEFAKASKLKNSKPGVEMGTEIIQSHQVQTEKRKTSKRDCSAGENEDEKNVSGKKFKPTSPVQHDGIVPTSTIYRCSFCKFGDCDKKTVQRCQKQCRIKQAKGVGNKT